MRTLRSQLIAAIATLVVVVGGLGAIWAYHIARDEPQELMDHQLRAIAENASDVPPRPPPPDPDPEPPDADDLIVIQIWDAAGATVRFSHPQFEIPRQTTAGFAEVTASDQAWRIFTLIEPGRTVQVGQLVEGREEIATQSALAALIPIVAIIPLSLLVIWPLVGRILLPVTRLTTLMHHRPAGSAEPLPLAGLPGEITPVVTAMNDLLGRQHALLEARQRFISDAAHQLRTPLTALRLQAENAARANADPQVAALLGELQGGMRRMSALATQLLDLARADGLTRDPDPAPVDLGALLRELVAEALPRADDRQVDLGLDAAPALTATASAANLRMLVGNLIDNALHYAPPQSRLDVSLTAEAGDALIRIEDQGPGIAEAELAQVFERFHRGANAEGAGSGLGLSIAQSLAEREGATIALANRVPGPGLRAEVRLPLSA